MSQFSEIKADAIFWFRRDLRLDDNVGLFNALKNHKRVLPVFVFDTAILDKLEDKRDRRVEFIHLQLEQMQKELVKAGSSLLVLHGKPQDIHQQLVEEIRPKAVYANCDYEPYALQRDQEVKEMLEGKGVSFITFKDHVIFEKDEVVKDDGSPYAVFTPYSRKWREKLTSDDLQSYSCKEFFRNWVQTAPQPLISLESLGFQSIGMGFPGLLTDREVVKKYAEQRDFPAIPGTSRLGIHLRFGTISIRELAREAKALNATFLGELIWRDFYAMILWHHPHVVGGSFRPKYDRIPWRNNETEFKAWCEGRTGYPIVDAGMRELNATGFMHNRVRMITASFLVKHLLIDWRWGEAYFAQKLLDFDLASNNGGWQWASGSGCDAAPYFRVFSPDAQTKKFDSKLAYIAKWVPEYVELDYPRPIVDHKFARLRAIETYKQALA